MDHVDHSDHSDQADQTDQVDHVDHSDQADKADKTDRQTYRQTGVKTNRQRVIVIHFAERFLFFCVLFQSSSFHGGYTG